MKQKLVIINEAQFGYHTDTYKYVQYLDNYKIEYICIDERLEKIQTDRAKVTYIPFVWNRKFTIILLFMFILFRYFFSRKKFFIVYFPYCFLLKYIMPFAKLHLDVRTRSISPKESVRTDYDAKLKKSIKQFKHISFISDGLANSINVGDYYLLPLGADIINSKHNNFEKLNLLYVGTFYNRNIEQTIEGLSLFLVAHPEYNNIHYHIVGFGEGEDEILRAIIKFKLSNYITFYGRKQNNELKEIFEKCNIGVSYIPITDYYQHQPPTKTYEYILSGLFCIATNTLANSEIVNSNNGILISDNSNDFAKSLEYIYNNKHEFSCKRIVNSLKEHKWENIVKSYLQPILESL